MFTHVDAQVFSQADDFDKLDALGDAYFPQLGALLVKANALIDAIYCIEPNESYKMSQAPTPSESRRDDATFSAKRNNTNQVLVGLRAKGEPKHLTKPDGAPCQMHFASLSFGIVAMDGEFVLAIGFEPYGLKYHQSHRDALADAVDTLKLTAPAEMLVASFQPPMAFKKLSKQLRKHGAMLVSAFIPGVDPDQQELAFLVVMYAAMFPFLDVFTRLSNGEDVAGSDYVARFAVWFNSPALAAYLAAFKIEPLEAPTSKVSEQKVRDVFKLLLGQEFPTKRPDWLRSPQTKAALELDGYCEMLNLAFEYQGEYHYIYVPAHHRERSLEQVKANDALKAKLCQQRSLSLVEVPYWERDNVGFIKRAIRDLPRPDLHTLLA